MRSRWLGIGCSHFEHLPAAGRDISPYRLGGFPGRASFAQSPYLEEWRTVKIIRLKRVKLCQQQDDKKPLTCGNTVPEVGLEPDSGPCGSDTPPKTRQSDPVRPIRRLKCGHHALPFAWGVGEGEP